MERSLWETPVKQRPGAAWLRGVGLFLCLWLGTFAALGAKFTTSLDRYSVVVGESVTLTFSFEGANPGGMPQLPNIPGLQPAGGMSQGFSSTTGPDGRMQNLQTYSVRLLANQPGEIQIPAFHVEVGNEKLSSQPLRLVVLREDPAAAPTEQVNSSAFLQLVLPKTNLYLGEVIVGELRLYVRSDVGNISDARLPEIASEGFNLSKMVNGQQFQRRVGNTTFTIVPMTFSLAPVKTGTFTIGSGGGSVVIHFGQRDFWGNFRQRSQVPLVLEAQTLNVQAPPAENMPAGFNGAIGQYSMTVNVGPTNVATGDPITVKVQISGRGNLNALSLPEQAAWQNFKVYPATADVETTDPLGLQGAKTFEQVIAPQTTDIKELPALTFSFFDPETKLYRTLAHPAVPLTVRPGGSAPLPVVAANSRNADETPPPPRDIVPIKQRLGRAQTLGPRLIQSPVFLAAQSVPVLAFVAAFLWRRRTDALANNPRLRRQRAVAERMRKGREELQRLAAANQAEEFHAALFRLLQEQLGERLDCPASAITEAVVDEKLRPRGVPDSTLDQIHELFQSCNLARYAPTRSSQELVAMIPKFESALRNIQEVKA